MGTVFYSWQSDLANKCNRSLIESALKAAVARVQRHPEIDPAVREDLTVDQDTRGVPGSPSIADTILAKIGTADACVFDVTPVTRTETRTFPNPNVLIELGYAMRAHPDAKILLVLNDEFGKKEELPFDIRHKRILSYTLPAEGAPPAGARNVLSDQLVEALELVYLYLDEHRFSDDQREFYLLVYNNVRSFLDNVAEGRHRRIDPWRSTFLSDCGSVAENLRSLTALDTAREIDGFSQRMNQVADLLDELANWEAFLQDGPRLTAKVEHVAKEGHLLVPPCLPAIRTKYRKPDHETEKRHLARRATDELGRFESGLSAEDMKSLNRVRSALANVGADLLRLSGELEAVEDPDLQTVRNAGHALHVADIRETRQNGFAPEKTLLNELRPAVESLRAFL